MQFYRELFLTVFCALLLRKAKVYGIFIRDLMDPPDDLHVSNSSELIYLKTKHFNTGRLISNPSLHTADEMEPKTVNGQETPLALNPLGQHLRDNLMPKEWKSFCSITTDLSCIDADPRTNLKPTLRALKPMCIQCNIGNEDVWNFSLFRNFTANLDPEVNTTFALTVKCNNNSNITLPWPMRAEKLVYISIYQCKILDFMSEYFNNEVNKMPDTLLFAGLSNTNIYVRNIAFFLKRNLKMAELTKAAECGPENALAVVYKNLTYTFKPITDPLKLMKLRKTMVSKSAREYHRGISSTPNMCNFKNMTYMDRSVSNNLGIKHDTILLQNSLYPNLKMVNLSHVMLREIPDKLKDWRLYLPSLTYLDLSHNNITDITPIRDYGTTADKQETTGTFDLTYNNITTVTLKQLKLLERHRYVTVNIRHNPFICNCAMLDFVKYFKHPNNLTSIQNTNSTLSGLVPRYEYFKSLKCHKPTQLKGRRIVDLTPLELECDLENTTILTAPIVILCTLVVILLLTIFIMVKYRNEIVILAFTRLHILLPCQHVEDTVEKKYDAFVAYSQRDTDWVTKVMVPTLENPNPGHQQPLKLCLHHRDFAVGAPIAENIVQSVESSRHSILVLSNNFLESEWCLLEFRTAFHQSLLEKKRHLIMIKLDDDIPDGKIDADLRRCMQTLTYVSVDDRLFWDKLIFALSDKRKNKIKFQQNVRIGVDGIRAEDITREEKNRKIRIEIQNNNNRY